MNERKKEVDKEFTRRYTLNPEAFEKLIAEKIQRAEMYTVVFKKQKNQALELDKYCKSV
jgi:hypothetical protein